MSKIIESFICCGPFYRDPSPLGSGFYIDNYHVNAEKYTGIADEACKVICTMDKLPQEGDHLYFSDQEKDWMYIHKNELEKEISFQSINRRAVLINAFLYTSIIAPKKGCYRFTFTSFGTSAIMINGQIQRTPCLLGRQAEHTLHFEVQLRKGKNPVLISLMNMHIHCKIAFLLQCDDENIVEECPLTLCSEDERRKTEQMISGFYIKKNIIESGERLTLYCNNELTDEVTFKIVRDGVESWRENNTVYYEKSMAFQKNGEYTLCEADLLNDGSYAIVISSGAVKAFPLTFSKLKTVVLPEMNSIQQRRQFITEYYAQKNIAAANLAMGNDVDEEQLCCMARLVTKRCDCADFTMHELLRIYYLYSQKLSNETRKLIHDTIIGFKYWNDETGMSMMFTQSENHQFCMHSCEYLAGQLFPDEIFTQSGQNGLFHVFKGKQYCKRWMREKGFYGFCEWHSNAYYAVDIMTLVNVYDFSDGDSDMKFMAKNLLDLLALLCASNSFRGIMACTHGRSYEEKIINPIYDDMNLTMWQLFGIAGKACDEQSGRPMILATSKYAPPKNFEAIARDMDDFETKTNMGLFIHSGVRGIKCSSFRTENYFVSGMIEKRRGEKGAQVHCGQALIDGCIPVFATCFETTDPLARPSYWGGQYSIPKTVAYKNMLAYIYNIQDKDAGYSHCYFPIDEFDEVIEYHNMIFGRKNDAYVAVLSSTPFVITAVGKYKNKELLTKDKQNIWLIEAGNKRQNGSFVQFSDKIKSGIERCDGMEMSYISPILGKIYLSWDNECICNGEQITGTAFPLIKNCYSNGGYGKGFVELYGHDMPENLVFDF